MIGLLFLGIAVLQVIVLLLSPTYKAHRPFSIYYKHVFRPLLQENDSYRWKYYIVPFFYFSLYLFIVCQFGSTVLPHLSSRLSAFEKILFIPLLIVLTPFLGVLSMVIAPTIARPGNAVREYPYDYLLYYPNVECRTCHTPKPARSKHCGICKACILVADHHCIWVNNCIGKGNYVYFFAFLFANSISMVYAFLRIIYIMVTRDKRSSSYPKSVQIFTILCGAFAVICSAFMFLQLDLVRNGMTTNEKDKWFTIQEIARESRLLKTPDSRWFIIPAFSASDLPQTNIKREVYSTNPYDPDTYNIERYAHVTNTSEIINIYDCGSFLANLRDLCT